MQRRRTLGKRHFGEFGSASGFITKRSRSDQEVPAMEDNGSSSSSIGNGSSSSGNGGASPRRPNKEILAKVPRYGTPVERTRVRTAGPYVLGHELGTSPGVPQTQYLARKDNTNEFYLLKILSYDVESELVNKETQQGKTLLHTEYSLLSLLTDLDGVIHHHGLFCDYALEEKQIKNSDGGAQWIYTGRVKRRLILVLDCVHAHEFCQRSSAYVNLQKYVQVYKFSEIEALTVFYEIVKVVEQLHQRNIIHRDLKLNNIVLNRRTNKVVITNFFLAKHLNSEDDNLYDQRGSPAYISPDVLAGKPYKGKPSDVWALGVILFTIVFGKFPFLDTTPSALFKKIRQADYTIPLDSRSCSPQTIQLIRSMLTLNPTERFTASEVRTDVERAISNLRGPRIEIDQIVPEMEEFDQPDTVPNGKPADSKPNYPSHELSREAFSQILESGLHRRENESFLRPRSLVSRSGSMRNHSSSVRHYAPFGNRVAMLSNNSLRIANSAGRSRPSVETNLNEAFAIRSPNTREVIQVRLSPITNSAANSFVTAGQTQNANQQSPQLQPQQGASQPSQQQQQASSVFVHVDAQTLSHVINLQTSNGHSIPIQLPTSAASTASITTPPAFQNPAIQSLYSAMNDMFARGRMPPPSRDESPEFQGIVTNEMANRIVVWLLINFRSHSIIREIFGTSSGNRVNNVLELLRRFGVQLESRAGQIVIRKEQSIDVLLLITYLLQVAGLNNNYFLNSHRS
ncbi:AAEL006449-PA [Aedes aegypti]|uniref:Serine/threonine-protein kinase 40 n=2 Tax=Aedes aegypti TaxID=7159 RepID=Q176C0_AEDAE|nr:serine/threonine-protein kinase 40 [Aedes aegypti]XP_021703529.1 serine/threonine-protein kinase 40 [Aedes aegypti]EAT41981.1 AAEL006449-PA [Aedes aegypti]